MREDGDASDKPIDIAVLTRMKQFRAMNKLKKVALKVIISSDILLFQLVTFPLSSLWLNLWGLI